MNRTLLHAALGLVLALPLCAHARGSLDWMDWDGSRYEEEAGAMAVYEAAPTRGVYAVAVADSTWLKGTPILGDYFVQFMYNDIEGGLYAGVGLTLRVQARWKYAPFIGGGGSYNQTLSRKEMRFDEEGNRRGDSYFAAHAEAGMRCALPRGFLEMLGRYTFSASDVVDANYPSVRIGWGLGF